MSIFSNAGCFLLFLLFVAILSSCTEGAPSEPQESENCEILGTCDEAQVDVDVPSGDKEPEGDAVSKSDRFGSILSSGFGSMMSTFLFILIRLFGFFSRR